MTLLQPSDVPSRTGINNAITTEIANHASLTDPASLHYDSGWVTIPLAAGWTVFGGETPRVRRIGKIVHVEGRVSGSISSTVATVGTLPAGFRPPVLQMIALVSNSPTIGGRYYTSTSGALQLQSEANATSGSLVNTFFID